MSAGACLTVSAMMGATVLAACHQTTRPPMASFPAHASLQCFVPSPEDYAVTMVVRDTAFHDSAWLRPVLSDVSGHWPVGLPLPRYALDVAVTLYRDAKPSVPRIAKASTSRTFDNRALAAVAAAVSDTSLRLPATFGGDSLPVLVRFGSMEFSGAIAQTWYSVARPPKPRHGNPEPDYPKEKQRGEQVIASFMVDSLGNVDAQTIDIVASTNDDFANAVVEVLPRWKFTPSMVRGCRVARTIRWEFGSAPE